LLLFFNKNCSKCGDYLNIFKTNFLYYELNICRLLIPSPLQALSLGCPELSETLRVRARVRVSATVWIFTYPKAGDWHKHCISWRERVFERRERRSFFCERRFEDRGFHDRRSCCLLLLLLLLWVARIAVIRTKVREGKGSELGK